MLVEPIYILYGAVFVTVLLLVDGLSHFIEDLGGGRRRQINRRLRMLADGRPSQDVLERLRRGPVAEGSAGSRPSRSMSRWLPGLERLIGQAGLMISTTRMMGIMAFLWVIVFLGITTSNVRLPLEGPLAAIIATILAIGLPIFYLLRRRRERLVRFALQLPDALDLIVRSLRAGHPVSAALGMVAREMQDPIGTEFGIAVDEITFGRDVIEAVTNMSDRVPQEDLRFVVAAINIQFGTGGNLAEILANLSGIIRDRFRFKAKIKALSAEGRISAMILSCLPFVIWGGMTVIRPDYFGDVKDNPSFLYAVAAAATLLVVGIVWMYRLVNFRV